MEDSVKIYQARMKHAEAIRVKFEAEFRKDGVQGCLIQHDFQHKGSMGLEVVQELTANDYMDIKGLKPAAQEHGMLVEKVFPEYYLCGVGDFDCDGKGLLEVSKAITGAPRPVCLTFALPDLNRVVKGSERLQIQSAVNAGTR